MTKTLPRRAYSIGLLVVLAAVGRLTAPVFANTATSKAGMVVTVHPLATDAGAKVLRDGGNAVDAAVAAAVTLGVCDGHNSGIGGGCFMLVRLADGTTLALDGREMAPAAATRDMFIRNGHGDTNLSQTGPLASGVPGSLAVYDYVLKKAGTKSLADVLLPAAELAERGFPLDGTYARKLAGAAATIAKFPETKRILLKPDGSAYKQGEVLKQPDLAKTYRAIGKNGIGYFYGGLFADAVAVWMKANGGVLTREDFARYEMKVREPLVTQYRGYTIVGFPPPSSGGVHVAQMLNILSHFDLKSMEEVDRITTIANAMKLAFADRAYWLGDPEFVKVPRGLIDAGYGEELAKRVDPKHATTVPAHGTPPKFEDDLFGKHTTHIATADAKGNFVALTCTVNTAFGSKVIVPGTGVILNNQMDDFSIEPGVANHFKLVGAEANAVGPGKRPLSSMSPTIVLKDGKPVLTVGAAGGPKIITQVLLALVNRLDLGLTPEEALKRPRFHHQWSPDQLWIENTFSTETRAALEKRGFPLDVVAPSGATQMIVWDEGTGEFVGVSEPRLSSKASGLEETNQAASKKTRPD